ncbi:MAG: hypothetical protein NBKEAIPA_01369 [Nitrospirae bacterium]|nr:MAG: hypothetical protein UZ03_NOB001003691 [Nitrospira sp. OLB3]MBV6469478.1 hypothetical protein [Nitrospirota bacterium]MCK6493894.1 DUF4149 domain-containing protein [Nitrospira sp.]MEB2337626.1 DUF4149 domain-containing protein [Nitrospirales bacterium]MCK6499882.1 DUF4149 domain-containing protein [Nitrospira sp.]
MREGAASVRQGLIACVTLELLALGIWIGGLVVLVAAVIPAVFNTFGGQDTGGFFLTRAFEGYNRLILGTAAALTAGLLWRAWLVRQGQISNDVPRTEWLLLGAMLVIAGIITFVLHPQAAALQAQAFASKGEEARKAAFEAFFQLHKPMRILYILNVGLGIALLTVRVRSWIPVKE